MHLKSIGYTDTVLSPPTSKVGDAVLLYFGKLDIYLRSVQVSCQPISIFIDHLDKNLLLTYLNFYGDRYPAYQFFETVNYPYILQKLVHLQAAVLLALKIGHFFTLTA